jgi:methyl-accepting chemotaxis protein
VLKLKHKIVGLALLAALLPALVTAAIIVFQRGTTTTAVESEIDVLAKDNIGRIALDVHALLETANNLVQQEVNYNSNVAKETLTNRGRVELSSETVTWQAVNQLTNVATSVELPKMTVGGTWLGQNRDMKATTPVVDDIKQLVGGTATIFQRMNKQGDMLRVATNVEAADKTRAIGTFIPAVNADGSANVVVSTVLRGETYRGRAFVVNAWYLSAYEPIKDGKGEIIGMLYVGIKQEAVESLRKAIMGIKVGKTGYVYILGGKGDQQGHYIISQNGLRDGEDIWGSKDADGRLFIQSIVTKALALKTGEVAFERYPWKNQGEATARMKIAAISYFEPWDWVIGAGSYEDDFYEARNKVDSALTGLILWSLSGAAIFVVATATLSFILGSGIARPLEKMARVADQLAAGDISQSIDYRSKDETGNLAEAFRNMIVASKAKAEVAEQIARGNLAVQVPVASDMDLLGKAMTSMRDSIGALVTEANMLTQAAVEGKLTTRGDASKFQGGYREIIRGVNDTLDAVIGPLNVAATYVDRIGRGDTPPKITDEYRGDFNTIKNNLNKCIDQIGILVDEVEVVINAAREGRLTERANAERTGGVYCKILRGLNDAVGAVIAPINDTRQVLTQVASGNLAVRMEGHYQGDFATLRDSIETMVKGLKGMASQSQQSAVSMTSATAEILASATQMASTTREQASAVTQVSSTVREIKASAEQVAQRAQSVAEQANQAAEAAQRGTGAVSAATQGMDDIRARVEAIAENILALSEQTRQIGEIIDTVTDIAGQSNILALNAAIEAAQAGEAGKGFRVVADEVRTLAEQSRQAAAQVKNILGDIQKATNQAVMATEQGTKGVQAGSEQVRRTAQTIEELARVVEQSAQAAQQIVAGVEQQTIGLDQIVIGINDINQAAQQSAAGAAQSQKAAQDLNELAEGLKQAVAQYRM